MPYLFLLFASLFHTIDPTSVQQNLAYYELYPESVEGKKALQRAATLLHSEGDKITLLCHAINPFFVSPTLNEEELLLIERLGEGLGNRKLLGYALSSEKEMIALEPEQIDLGRAVILSQTQESEKARSYSALLDLMALQIKATFKEDFSMRQKIEAMNRFVFETMRFRFPPQSLYAKNIDRYTFLAQVMDEHLGVCLGVSTMVLALGQRLEIPLEAMTPPGHIYVRYRDENEKIVIETTMRGVDVPEEQYLSIHTHHLTPRTLKEVVGMAHVNEASCSLHRGEWEQAKKAYQKALLYLPEDPMVLELLGFSKLFVGESEGRALLEKAISAPLIHTTLKHKMAEDFLEGKVDLTGVQIALKHVDEKKESLEKKRDLLIEVMEKFPQFREGWNQLAITWVMLHRAKEAMLCLEKLERLDQEDPITYYYLTILHGQRKNYKMAWHFFLQAEKLLKKVNYMPKVLKDLRYELTLCSPERR